MFRKLRVKKNYLYKPFKLYVSNKNKYIICGFLGIVKLNILYSFSYFFFFKNSLFFLINAHMYQTIISVILKNILGISRGWLLEFDLIGRGMHAYISNGSVLKLNIGLSHSISFKIPSNLLLKCSKSYILAYSISLNSLHNFGDCLRNLRRLDSYKGYGIKYKNEFITLKMGKQS